MPVAAPPRQILVVDDELLIRRLTQMLLENSGFRVVTAAGGEEALELCRSLRDQVDLLGTAWKMNPFAALVPLTVYESTSWNS
jgi:sigma-B regulation protein RsbU (phosphoserine phosphatase)